MRSVLVLIFLLGSLLAKDNFVYNEDKIKCDERLTQLEDQMAAVKTTQGNLLKYAKMAETTKVGVEQNERKIAKITMMNRANDKKVSQIADSLSGIKNILAESKEKLTSGMGDPDVIVEPVMAAPEVDTADLVKKDEFARHAVEVDNLMDRVSILEKKSMMKPAMGKQTAPSTMEQARSAIYDYFEYYVIATVILFFMMFIIIFSLVGKTRHLQMVVNDILDRD
jgi:hypothetical protein